MEQKLLKVGKINVDEKYYPRMKWSWHTAYKYSQAMNSGADFPDIEVAKIKGNFYLVDGRHRLEANKMNGEKNVQCVVNKDIKSLKELYVEAIKRNAKHGQPFSVQERANIALKLKKLNWSDEDVSKLIAVPIKKFEKFVAKRVTNTVSGETIPVKKTVSHMSDEVVGDDFETIQDGLHGTTQVTLLDEFIHLLDNDLLDTSNKDVMKRVNKIINLVFKLEAKLNGK